jgi:hypothetical protein
MEPTWEVMAQNLAERLGWQAARRDDSRVARRLVLQAGGRRRLPAG